jgi:hypothetical protein
MSAEVSVTGLLDCFVAYQRTHPPALRTSAMQNTSSSRKTVRIESLARRLTEVAEAGGRVDIEVVKQTVDEIATMEDTPAKDGYLVRPPMRANDWAWFTVRNVARLTILCVAMQQPFLWKGPQYRRHWCGNPGALEGNTCTLEAQSFSTDLQKDWDAAHNYGFSQAEPLSEEQIEAQRAQLTSLGLM